MKNTSFNEDRIHNFRLTTSADVWLFIRIKNRIGICPEHNFTKMQLKAFFEWLPYGAIYHCEIQEASIDAAEHVEEDGMWWYETIPLWPAKSWWNQNRLGIYSFLTLQSKE